MIFEQWQHAFYAHDDEQAEAIKQSLGVADAEWIEDIVEGDVWVRGGDKERSVAKLRFCYAFPVELEILTYLEGPNWHANKLVYKRGLPFMSHIGFHMKAGQKAPLSGPPVQRMVTRKHSNPYLIEKGRTFRYEIFSRWQSQIGRAEGGLTAAATGCDMKYIWRIEEGEK